MTIGKPLTPFSEYHPFGRPPITLHDLRMLFGSLKNRGVTFVIVILADKPSLYGESSCLSLILRNLYFEMYFRNRQAMWRTSGRNVDVVFEE